MASELFTNFATTTLAAGISSGDTTITINPGDGTSFPSPTGGDFFRAVLFNKANGNTEIVQCTARSTDTLTVTRAQESTTAVAFSAGDLLELRATAATFGSYLTTGVSTGDANVFTAEQTIRDAASEIGLTIDNGNGTNYASRLRLQSSSLNRWLVGKDSTAEAGSNAGSDFFIDAYDDAGSSIGTALAITRADMEAAFGAGVSLADSKKLKLGAGDDLQAYHDGTHSYVDNNTGELRIRNLANSQPVDIYGDDSGGTSRQVASFGGSTPYAQLYYNASRRLYTDTNGAIAEHPSAAVLLSKGLAGTGTIAAEGSGTNNALMVLQNATTGELARVYADNSKNLILSTDAGVTSAISITSGGVPSIAATPSAGDNSTKIATTAYIDSLGLTNFDIHFELQTGANATFTLHQYAQFAYTVEKAYYKTDSGTISADVKIDGTSITGLSALSLTSTEGNSTATAAKTVNIGNTLTVVTTSDSSAVNVSITLHCTRS